MIPMRRRRASSCMQRERAVRVHAPGLVRRRLRRARAAVPARCWGRAADRSWSRLLPDRAPACAGSCRRRRQPSTIGRRRSALAGRALVATARPAASKASATSATTASIFWSLAYLAITASLIGVLGVLGPDFAAKVLGLSEQDFVVVVLPARRRPGRRASSRSTSTASTSRAAASSRAGCVALGISLRDPGRSRSACSSSRTAAARCSLLTVVMAVAFAAGIAYAFVAVPAQTQLQEELPSEVRGRVFGVLNMLVSLASFLPIIIVGRSPTSSALPR